MNWLKIVDQWFGGAGLTLNQRVQGSKSLCAHQKDKYLNNLSDTCAAPQLPYLSVRTVSGVQGRFGGPLDEAAQRQLGPWPKPTAANKKTRSLGSCGVQTGMSGLCQ